MENEKKEEKKLKLPNPINVDFHVSGFPLKQWMEWKHDCEVNYNDMYWSKIWSDHLKAKNSDLQGQLLAQQVLAESEVEEEPKTKDTVQCLDGEY